MGGECECQARCATYASSCPCVVPCRAFSFAFLPRQVRLLLVIAYRRGRCVLGDVNQLYHTADTRGISMVHNYYSFPNTSPYIY